MSTKIETECESGLHFVNLICEDRVTGRKCQFRDLKIRMLEDQTDSFSVSAFIKSNSTLHIFMSSCMIFQPDGDSDVDLMLGFYPSEQLNSQIMRVSDQQMKDKQLIWKFERIPSQRSKDTQQERKEKEETKLIVDNINNHGRQREETKLESKQNNRNKNSSLVDDRGEGGSSVELSNNQQECFSQETQNGTNCNAMNIEILTKKEKLESPRRQDNPEEEEEEEENICNNVKEEDLSERTLDSPSSGDAPQCKQEEAREVASLSKQDMSKLSSQPTFQSINRKRKHTSINVKQEEQNQQLSAGLSGSQNRDEKDTGQQDEYDGMAEEDSSSILEGLSPPKMKKQQSAPATIQELPFLSAKTTTSTNKPLLFRNSNSSFQAYNPLSSILLNNLGNASPVIAAGNSEVRGVSASTIPANNQQDKDNGVSGEKSAFQKNNNFQAETQQKFFNDSIIPSLNLSRNPNNCSALGLLQNSNFVPRIGGAFQAKTLFSNPGSSSTANNGVILQPEMMALSGRQSKNNHSHNSNTSVGLLQQQQQQIALPLIHSSSSTNLGGNNSSSSRQSRNKERTIREAIQMVTQWRDLQDKYRQQHQARGLQEVADELNISKKVLDYYFQELRTAEFFGFDFDSHLDCKMGVLRKFIEDSKKLHENDNQNFKITRNLQFRYRLREDQIQSSMEYPRNNGNNTPQMMPQFHRKKNQLPGNVKQQPMPQIDLSNTAGSNVDKTMLFLELLTQQAQRTTLTQTISDQATKQKQPLPQPQPQSQEQQQPPQQPNSQIPQQVGSQPKVIPSSMEDIISFMKLLSSAANGNPNNQNADFAAASTLCSVAADFLQPQNMLASQSTKPTDSIPTTQAENEE